MQAMKTAIFDMDGTLIDSMSWWRKLNILFLHDAGITPTPEQEAELYTLSGMRAVSYYKENFGIETSFDQLVELATNRMEQIYRGGLPLKPGARAFLTRLRGRGVSCVLATATAAKQALVALNRMDLVRYFDHIYSTDMIGGYKGQPDFFDRLCEAIGADKADCVLFEDSLYAVRAAAEAGLRTVAITDSTNEYCREELRKACGRLIESYDELP